VIVLHGIGHSRWNMYWVERALRKDGFEVINITYPSLRHDLNTLTAFLQGRLEKLGVWSRTGKIHFVTHSMGGLLTRHYLDIYRASIPADRLGRIVMLAPPHGGSEIADFLRDFPPYKWSFGPAGQELTTAAQRLNTARPYYDLGIIAGTRKWPYFIANFIIPGEHDGRVSVERTKLDGMKDHLTLPATHSFISWKPEVHSHIKHFLRNGSFRREK
jgi:pimeloyl-ACP methyl ester carboxylesterase